MAEQKSRMERRKKKPLWLKLFFLILLLGLAGLLTGAGVFAYYANQAPPLNEKDLVDPAASQILDKDGNVVAAIGNKKREQVNYDEIPGLVEDAILATEDVRFYEHFGIDPLRLGGAIIANITEGFGSEGASTLTQQVIKRSFLSSEKSLKRKAQEAWLAVKLEQEYSKQEIFEMYVNKIYYSDNIYGIATAADYYFDKELDELTLPQAALLAGMPQSPNGYNPYDHPERAKERRDIVLSLMEEHDKITHEERMKAEKTPITEGLVKRDDGERTYLSASDGYEAFIDVVISEVDAIGDYNIYEDGLKIHTTLDPDAQSAIEDMLNKEDAIDYPEDKDGQPFQAGITLLDTKNGAIRAVGGGRNYAKSTKRAFNFATDTSRQPGSVIKPILAYGPAIEYKKWSTAHIVNDEEFEYENGEEPHNWDGKYKGEITIREALWDSRNIPAIKTFNEAGHENAADFAKKLGLNLEEPLMESAAIGGISKGTSPLQIAGAYAAFGNGGTYNEPYTVTKIEQRDGKTLETNHESHQAMEDYTSYMVTDMLKDVIKKPEATGYKANISGLPVAGKTGTTNYSEDSVEKYNIPEDSSPDSWFAGYTTDYTAAIWTGYQDRKNPLTGNEKDIAKKIFKHVMANVTEEKDTEDFKKPDSVVEKKIEEGTNPPKLASSFTPEDKISTELFVKGEVPKQESDEFIPELPAPEGLSADYDKDKATVQLDWDYEQNEDDDREVHFEVEASAEGGSSITDKETDETEITIPSIKSGESYTFTVRAVSEEEESDPASIVVDTDTEEEDSTSNGDNQSSSQQSEETDSDGENEEDSSSSSEDGNKEEDTENETDNQSEQENEEETTAENNSDQDTADQNDDNQEDNSGATGEGSENEESDEEENEEEQDSDSSDESSENSDEETDGDETESSENSNEENNGENESNNNESQNTNANQDSQAENNNDAAGEDPETAEEENSQGESETNQSADAADSDNTGENGSDAADAED
ncbi:PBP1A family penicillin-binding protein [Sediminibacillus dalangtanensis]|uniref:PBP1A family penicillin-binding protein n=1 Tax=Sediminibacillus dalangtanensis TaxID=2729421 RepID=A0ABX7VQU5_9BACI|nr:penicillin-binding protein 1A [Sediminibacillus dalangtanensis]QTM98888.1 PBP1A family penicillin-binding protein [Sediminibacillus dalangtanensis]